jgi:hypothetical protein
VQLISDERAEQDANISPNLQQLADFARESVHPEFALVDTAPHGVGFHYGSIPPLLRRSIEDAFRTGEIRFLACTSTLLHGVNLPARNLFLNRPTRGNNQGLQAVDFWNLAGRAGRLGKEFEGDVYLIDYEHWSTKPLEGEQEITIKPTLDRHLGERAKDLIDYINNPNSQPDVDGEDEFENTFTKLYSDHRTGRLNLTLDRFGLEASPSVRDDIRSALTFGDDIIYLDDELVQANPTVSVYRQQRLYDYMLEKIDEKGAEYLMPIHPLAPDAKNNLMAIFKRCHTYILQWSGKDRRHIRAAVFAVPWMKGEPLPKIIDEHLAYERKRNPKYKTSTGIINTLETIEQDVRFTYVRLTGCYNSLLRGALKKKGYDELAEQIVLIPLFMEVGACSRSMMSFIGLGLSRISARQLTEAAGRQNFDPLQAKRWLSRQRLDRLDVSPIIAAEVRRILETAL